MLFSAQLGCWIELRFSASSRQGGPAGPKNYLDHRQGFVVSLSLRRLPGTCPRSSPLGVSDLSLGFQPHPVKADQPAPKIILIIGRDLWFPCLSADCRAPARAPLPWGYVVR